MTAASPHEGMDAPAWEAALVAAIQEVTGLSMPVDASFFAAGLTSATLVGVFERLADKLPPDVPVTVFFKYPTRRSLARHLSEQAAPGAASLPEAVAGPSGRITAQHRRDIRSRLRERKG
ncbi:acyl carrier protein [Nonomuraea sp. NPDC050786]|uniref:acyl carrier protein n=1 Tax=Nonomuraea sp. NPDC050786 TaxID=3154840 RepID=UPI003408DE59